MELAQIQADLIQRGKTPRPKRPRSPILDRALDQVEVFPPRVAGTMTKLRILLDRVDELYLTVQNLLEPGQYSSDVKARREGLAQEKTKDLIKPAEFGAEMAARLRKELEELTD